MRWCIRCTGVRWLLERAEAGYTVYRQCPVCGGSGIARPAQNENREKE